MRKSQIISATILLNRQACCYLIVEAIHTRHRIIGSTVEAVLIIRFRHARSIIRCRIIYILNCMAIQLGQTDLNILDLHTACTTIQPNNS